MSTNKQPFILRMAGPNFRRLAWAFLAAGGAVAAGGMPSESVTLYVNPYFEVRDREAPTKYVWNAEARVARVTGSLSPNSRVQRLRLWPGWNLCSTVVAGARLPSNSEISAAYNWNSLSKNWDTFDPNASLPSDTVLWLQTIHGNTLRLVGSYSDPTNLTLTAHGDFLSNAGLEVSNLKSALSKLGLVSAWTYDASLPRWYGSLPSGITDGFDLADLRAPGEPIFARTDGSVNLEIQTIGRRIAYYHADHLGSLVFSSDATAATIEDAAYCPFGITRAASTGGEEPEPYRFTGKETDSETHLQYFESRYLAGNLARFCRLDPLANDLKTNWLRFPQKLNLYASCNNNPIRYTDPSGMDDADKTSATMTPEEAAGYPTPFGMSVQQIQRIEQTRWACANRGGAIATSAAVIFGGGLAVAVLGTLVVEGGAAIAALGQGATAAETTLGTATTIVQNVGTATTLAQAAPAAGAGAAAAIRIVQTPPAQAFIQYMQEKIAIWGGSVPMSVFNRIYTEAVARTGFDPLRDLP